MSMRSQIYAWNSQAGTAWTNTNTGTAVSIFIGGIGNNITKPAETTATQFVVIEDVAVSPTAFLFSGPAVNTIYRGLANGAGKTVSMETVHTSKSELTPQITSSTLTMLETMVFRVRQVLTHEAQTSNLVSNLYPDVYVLPGQVFDALVTTYQNGAFLRNPAVAASLANNGFSAFMKYTLYDGPGRSHR